jgi:hypothetical protein
MGSIRQSVGIAAVLGMAFASSALAQDARQKLMIDDSNGLGTEVGHFPRGAPGTSTGSPIAYGANWGDVYAGAGLQAPIRYSNASDGSLTVGMGFGNAKDLVGLDVGLNLLSTVRSGVGNRMSIGGKLHKLFGDGWGIAVGAQGIYLGTKPLDSDGNASIYGVVSHVWDLQGTWFSDFKSLTLSAGAGNEGFRLEQDIRTNNKTVGAFGSAALRLMDQIAVIVDWPGQDLDVGVSVVPFKNFPLVLTPAIVDVTGSAGTFNTPQVVRPRFSLGAGMAIRF